MGGESSGLLALQFFELLANAPSLGTSFLLFKATGFMILQVFTVLGGQVGNALTFSAPLLRYPRVTWVDAIAARFLRNYLVVIVVTVLMFNFLGDGLRDAADPYK